MHCMQYRSTETFIFSRNVFSILFCFISSDCVRATVDSLRHWIRSRCVLHDSVCKCPEGSSTGPIRALLFDRRTWLLLPPHPPAIASVCGELSFSEDNTG